MTKSIITSTFLTFVCLFNLQAFAQSANCDELKKENEYLKKALSILTPVKTVTTDKIDFNISKCEGNIKQQTVELTVVVTNHGPHSELSLRKAVAVDAEGNEFQTYQIKIGSGSSINKIYTDEKNADRLISMATSYGIDARVIGRVEEGPNQLEIRTAGKPVVYNA